MNRPLGVLLAVAALVFATSAAAGAVNAPTRVPHPKEGVEPRHVEAPQTQAPEAEGLDAGGQDDDGSGWAGRSLARAHEHHGDGLLGRRAGRQRLEREQRDQRLRRRVAGPLRRLRRLHGRARPADLRERARVRAEGEPVLPRPPVRRRQRQGGVRGSRVGRAVGGDCGRGRLPRAGARVLADEEPLGEAVADGRRRHGYGVRADRGRRPLRLRRRGVRVRQGRRPTAVEAGQQRRPRREPGAARRAALHRHESRRPAERRLEHGQLAVRRRRQVPAGPWKRIVTTRQVYQP